ncbi:MAG: hypothetical protein Q9157_000274 [Trypethelium eluteriae]
MAEEVSLLVEVAEVDGLFLLFVVSEASELMYVEELLRVVGVPEVLKLVRGGGAVLMVEIAEVAVGLLDGVSGVASSPLVEDERVEASGVELGVPTSSRTL